MAEQSSGGGEGWKCPNPQCGLVLPSKMTGMNFCPSCGTAVKQRRPKGAAAQETSSVAEEQEHSHSTLPGSAGSAGSNVDSPSSSKRKTTPPVSPDSPPTCKDSPPTGKDSPPTGEETPSTGKDSPPVGNDWLQAIKDLPPVSKDSSAVGNDSPPAGKDLPPVDNDSPQTGKDLPPVDNDSPQTGKDLPPVDNDSPQAGKDLPPVDNDSPQTGKDLPPVDNDSPQTGKDLPPVDNDSPQAGKDLPPVDNDSPQTGKDLPPVDNDSPQTGKDLPPVDNDSPQTGKDLPPVDNDSPQTGKDLTPVDNNLPTDSKDLHPVGDDSPPVGKDNTPHTVSSPPDEGAQDQPPSVYASVANVEGSDVTTPATDEYENAVEETGENSDKSDEFYDAVNKETDGKYSGGDETQDESTTKTEGPQSKEKPREDTEEDKKKAEQMKALAEDEKKERDRFSSKMTESQFGILKKGEEQKTMKQTKEENEKKAEQEKDVIKEQEKQEKRDESSQKNTTAQTWEMERKRKEEKRKMEVKGRQEQKRKTEQVNKNKREKEVQQREEEKKKKYQKNSQGMLTDSNNLQKGKGVAGAGGGSRGSTDVGSSRGEDKLDGDKGKCGVGDDDKTAQSQYRKSEAPDELFSGTRGRQSHKKDTSKGASAQQESTVPANKERRQPKYDYKKHHQGDSESLTGLNSKRYMLVTFHCILPKLLWEWDEKSSMYIRFDGDALGDWKVDVGIFKEHRKLGEGVYEMTCTLKIAIHLLSDPKGYKYVVFSPKMVHEYDCFEYLHTFIGKSNHHQNPNRCLIINPADRRDGGEYHQYDFFVYPKARKLHKGVLSQAWDTSVGLFNKYILNLQESSATEQSFTPLPTDKMMERCLLFYLEPCQDTLLSNASYPKNFSIAGFIIQVKHIFEQHYNPVVQHSQSVCHVPVENLKNVFKKWLEEVIKHLEGVSNPLCRFVSSVCIASCILDCHVSQLKQAECVYPLLRMLHIQPNMETKTCPNVSFLFSIASEICQKQIQQAVLQLCKNAMRFKTTLETCWDWLYVLPLCHFLSGAIQPFANLEYNPNHFGANRAKKFGYDDLRSKLIPGFVDRFYASLQPFFSADPLLLYDFVYICPEDDFQKLFNQIPAFLSLTHLSYTQLPHFPAIASNWTLWLEAIREKLKRETLMKQHCVATVNAAKLLMKSLFFELNIQEYQLNVLKLVITVLLYSLCKMDILVELDEKGLTETLGVCELALQEWLKREDVVGGIYFGKSVQKATKLLYESTELKLWSNILSLEVPQNRRVADAWNTHVTRVIKQRVAKVPDSSKIGLVYMLEEDGREDVHPLLSTLLMEAATEAIDRMTDYGNLPEFGKSERMGKLFGQIFLKKYPQLEAASFTVCLDDLLSWPYWANFIKIYSGNSKAKNGLPIPCQDACAYAISLLDEVSRQLREGDITIRELEKIYNNLQQITRLYDSVQRDTKQGQDFSEINSIVSMRLEEFRAFQEELGQLQHLCHMIHHSVIGIPEANAELQMTYDDFKINTLCVRGKSGGVKATCFIKAHPLVPFVKQFYLLTKRRHSAIFGTTWSATIKQARRNNQNFSITDLESEVWNPAFLHCEKLLTDMYELTITLGDVDKHFMSYDKRDIITQLNLLLQGVNECNSLTHGDAHQLLGNDWIPCSVQKIVDYRQLCYYRDAADSFLRLREVLNLSGGDFSDVEKISREISSSMKDQKLAEITDELVQAGRFLGGFTGEMLECIQSFCACQNIVKWIRKTTKDVSDLQNFVNVALATAEDDLANDKLSSLRTVGSGFSSLIYKLGSDAGFQELCNRCSSVWEAYRNDENLPKMLVSCNESLEWYKSVKETQASVEVTSFGQMKNILNYGWYAVGISKDVAMGTIHSVIHLRLTETGKKLVKTKYTLDDLRDLESKLVLITGSKAENREEVDHFLNTFHSVCRIAEVLIKLQQAGNVQYIGWKMDIFCQTLLVDELQKQAKEMEGELERWNREVTLARKNFYELNYYTTRQLLILRSELGRLKSSRQPSKQHNWVQVMSLLGSISSTITVTALTNVVQQVVNTPLPDLEQDSDSPSESVVEEPSSGIASEHAPNPAEQKAIISPKAVLREPRLPHVGLSQKDLNADQRAHFLNIRQKFAYSEMTVLKAIEAVNGGDWNDIVNCLQDHGDEWDEIFEEAEETDESEEEADDFSEENEQTESSFKPESEIGRSLTAVSPHSVSSPSSSQPWSRVVVTRRQHIDETNEEVQELLDAGMGSVEECIQAIEVYGTANMAFNPMMELQEKGPLSEEGLLPVSEGHTVLALPHQPAIETDKVFISVKDVWDQFLGLKELGTVLKRLSEKFPATVHQTRRLLSDLKRGQPHLLVVPPDQVLRAALSLYMEDSCLPLPTPEEMLICHQNTTAEEVNLLWQRAVCDPGFQRIFCLVHAEKLSYQTADKALRALTEIIQHKADYSLVIICSNFDEDKSLIISKLHLYRRPYGVSDTGKCRDYLKKHFVKENQPSYQQVLEMENVNCLSASVVDPIGSCVRLVSSDRAGMGKTLFVTRMAEKLQALIPRHKSLKTIPIHGPVVTTDSIMECLVSNDDTLEFTILQFDISPSVLWQMDSILFSLLIQGGLCDSQGRVWRNHPTQLYAIEVTVPERCENKTMPEHLTLQVLELLPTVNCLKPKIALSLMLQEESDFGNRIVMDKKEFESQTLQRVYQYLRRHTVGSNLDVFFYNSGSTEGTPQDCLEIFLTYCGVKNPSWAEIGHFVKFLDLQLQSCEKSYFTNPEFVGDVMTGFKGFVVKFMIQMSRDFFSSSLRGEVAQENEEDNEGHDALEQYQIIKRKQWEHSSHPYLFFNQDGMSFTFVGFLVTSDGDLCDPTQHGAIIERGIMTQQLYTGLKAQRVNFDEDYHQWPKDVMIQMISTVMGVEWPHDPDPTYVLTVDNLIKILAIQMRFRCGIPVVIMGETGCGKTRLIRFMCNLASQGSSQRNMLILKVHGGTTDVDIVALLRKAEESTKENRSKNLDTVVFFDEANTTDAIGLIKEIMCDRRVHGRPVSEDLKFIAACNPYRRHTNEMIEKLHSAGLGFYVRDAEIQQKFGRIPLRELVYRVIDLPPSMRPLVYDFGQLNTDTERDYTTQIVHDHVMNHALLKQQIGIIPAVARVLAWSQNYMRERKNECSFVSLRDVERTMVVFIYFIQKMDLLRADIDMKEQGQPEMNGQMHEVEAPVAVLYTDLIRSLILAVSVCYHARLSDRRDYEQRVAHEFTAPLSLPGGANQFENVIRWSQEVLLESMVVGENIAHNAALRENVFMMAVCVDLRIPLFLVGKPGSSKSLAKSIVADSMRGQASQKKLLQSFKQVHMFSYQCSQLSTSQSVIEVFNTAKRFQKDQDTTKYVSVVVLDEVGLAEDSPNLPLKALHPLLEDGTEGSEDRDEVIAREKRVAFIGISNWALDPAKMNRGVMVTRGDPDVDELVLSAQGICHNERSDVVKDRLSDNFQVLAEAYHEICEQQKRQFFGLRDFYSLIKMLYWMCEKTNMPPTGPQLVHAIRRNFGGLEESGVDPEKIFFDKLPRNIDEAPDLTNIDPAIREFISPDNSQRGLIKTSLKTKETSWHGENRYLLFLTENYAALEILQQYLQDQGGGHPLFSVQSEQSSLKPWEMEPFVLFGSSFPKDKEYTQVCRNINQIKICMEIGRTVILLNLENLYESLYDVLNQYYIHHGGNRYVDLGLQTHKVKCRVHDEFKLILIAEKTTVYKEFPTPLINRLEKHFVLYSSVLEDWQRNVLNEMEQWIKDFSDLQRSNSRFKESDAFVGYQEDVAAAVVFLASSQLRKACERLRGKTTGQQQLWETAWEDGLLGRFNLEQLTEEDKGSHSWQEAVLLIGQFLLLQTTAPAALVRLGNSKLRGDSERLTQIYRTQHHGSIKDSLCHLTQENYSRGGLLLQVTTHSHLLSSDEVDGLSNSLQLSGSPDVFSFLLQEFDTELDFTSKVSPLFVKDEELSCVLIIQCDSGHINGDLIACARYRIYDMRAKALLNRSKRVTHVVFIIHLPVHVAHSTFVGFQGAPWISCHIDELRPSNKNAITLEVAQEVTVSELFYGGLEYTGLMRQTSETSSNMESMVFERLSSIEEGLEERIEDNGGYKYNVLQDEGEMEIIDVDDESDTKDSNTLITSRTGPMESNENKKESSIKSASHLDMQKASNKMFSNVNKQCIRLNSCIQAAASRLQDSTRNKERAAERVRLLIKVISHDPMFPLESGTFYTILVCHIYRMLQEREAVYQDDDWVLKEAMDMHNLQTGGTFMNALTRKLDDIVTPCLAEIVAFVDRSCNLGLLLPEHSPLSLFWLKIFGSKRAEEALRFTDMVGGEKVEINHDNFTCEFPFFWMVKELIDSHWDSAQSTGGRRKQEVHNQLCLLVSDSSLGDVLLSIQDGGQCEELYRRYLHDFVRSVHKCTHKMEESVKVEYQLIQDSLHNMVVRSPDFSTIDGNVSLIDRIAAVHVVYQANCECIHWFGQLTSHRPAILDGLQTEGQDDTFVLHLYAMDKILSGLEPPIKANRESKYSDDQSLRVWFNDLREVSNTIESTLSLPSQHPIALKARLRWQKIRAIHMFTEHVVLNHSNMIIYARQLDLALRSESNFLIGLTIEKVKRILNSMVRKLKSEFKTKEQKKLLLGIKKSCTNFFIEVVSGLCFGQSSAPEDSLVGILLDTVFTEQREMDEGGEGEGGTRGTRNLTPFKDDVEDRLPVIRSFLLQLLLEHSTVKVKCHLKTYFERCQQALVGGMGVNQELSLLCTQCFENAIDKEYCEHSLESKAEAMLEANLFKTSTDTLVQSAGFTEHTISLEVLESVAKIRYCLRVVAELLQLRVSEQGHSQAVYGHLAHQLLEEARHACTETKINSIDTTGKSNSTGPIVYLLKLLVNHGGFSCLTKIVKDTQLMWMVPEQLEQDKVKEKNALDLFVMYNPAYATVKEEMSAAAYGRDYKELEEHTATLQPQECVLLLLATYEVCTMSRASTNIAKQLLPETIKRIDDMIQNCDALSIDMKMMARKLIANDQGGHLAAFQVTASQATAQQSMGALAVHVVATLISRSNLDPLCPMVTLLKAPGTLAESYLPTMAEDFFPEAKTAMKETGAFYECPNGHPYFIGDCGRAVVQANCIVCGSAIGGTNYVLAANNITARTTDETQTGYSLGHPTTRSNIPSPERSLSPAACCIIRAIMHSALLWVSCNDDSATEGLLALVTSGLRGPQELPEFFWGHLEKDVQLLAKALGRNPEDAATVIHLVLRNILTITPPGVAIPLKTLDTRDVRKQWENQFNELYINPILERLETELATTMAAILNDNTQGHDPIYSLVYEHTHVVKDSLELHLWSYRPRITLEHLIRYMQQQKKKFPILEGFLKNEAVLIATQYIPDIVKLQKLLFDELHHRIDHKVAQQLSMKGFILKQHTGSVRNEYRKMVSSVQNAWVLVRDKLKEHGQLKVGDRYLLEELGLDTPLEYFIPTTTGPGACTFSLVHYLCYVHNNFIDWCRAKSIISTWREHKIQLVHIHRCHLLDYQSQLQSILLSHCHYSLRVGEGHEVSYDLPALEKCILDRFIHGKPVIDIKQIPHVSYQKDVYTAAMFAAVRKNVAPQRVLQHRVQLDILRELGSPDKLRKSLDVVEIVLGFLTSGGGKPKTRLLTYLRKLKMEKRSFSEKEPFHTLNPELLEDLTEKQCQQLNKALPKVDLSALLGTLYEFIETFIRHIDLNNLEKKRDWHLLDTLPPHLEASNLDPSPDIDKLPEDITLAQTAATWKYIVHFQAQQRQQ